MQTSVVTLTYNPFDGFFRQISSDCEEAPSILIVDPELQPSFVDQKQLGDKGGLKY
jgi:hypothetical protein